MFSFFSKARRANQTSEPDEILIRVRDLTKIYRVGQSKLRALDHVNLDIRRGEFCAITGPSGSGKSTLLNLLAGLEPPTRGKIVIDGETISGLKENRLVAFRRRKVGFIFQSFNLIPSMNCLENIALPLIFQGISKRRRNRRAAKMLQFVGLSSHAKHRPSELSGGQQQRIGIARALVSNPAIVFADEPTGNLDSATSRDVLTFIRRIAKEQNQTFIMVTHDLDLAQYADKIFIIVDGKITRVLAGRKPEEEDPLQRKSLDHRIDSLGLTELRGALNEEQKAMSREEFDAYLRDREKRLREALEAEARGETPETDEKPPAKTAAPPRKGIFRKRGAPRSKKKN